MIDPSLEMLFRQVRFLQLMSRKKAEDFLIGSWRSCFKGNGMEFNEVRPFQAGDEVRSIDWNVTARQGSLYAKTFQEERKLEVHLFCDISSSMYVGGEKESKRSLMAKTAAVLGFSAWKNRDRIGGCLFSDRIEKRFFPESGQKALYKMIRDILSLSPEGKKSALSAVFHHADQTLKKPAIVFILSDFLFPCEQKMILRLAKRHTLFGVQICDLWDFTMPDKGVLLAEDSETLQRGVCDTSSWQEKRKKEEEAMENRDRWKKAFVESGGRFTTLQTEGAFWQPLKKLLARRFL